MIDFAEARAMMVDSQLRTSDVNDGALLDAFAAVPREAFVPADRAAVAYADIELPLEARPHPRSMMTAAALARLLQAVRPRPGESALVVGCGYGYAAALLQRLGAARVVALEASPTLAAAARERLARHAPEVEVVEGPLERGAPHRAPFDVILVEGSVDDVPDELVGQLAEGGRLVAVVGRGRAALATLFLKTGGTVGSRHLFDVLAPELPGFRKEPGFAFAV
jgi:protein-L-isoaspartate(D-aspartate) O-methyltransferase